MNFQVVYIPVGVGTYHMETAHEQFHRSVSMLLSLNPDIICPEDILLSLEDMRSYICDFHPDLVIFQNITFANASYMSEILHRFKDCPIVLWALREPVIDGGRLRINSLTGAYSAANTLHAFHNHPFVYTFGAPEEASVQETIKSSLSAAKIKADMNRLRMAAIGHTPQGFGFGRALDSELLGTFGVELTSIEARELIDLAKTYTDEDCKEYIEKTKCVTCGLDKTPEKNTLDHARLLKAYESFVTENHIGALASRCWPDFFTAFGTPVCTVLSMLNNDGIAAACEADIYGALSMWVGMQLSGEPVFFGDPVALDENESTITYWHCGAAACSLARKDTGAVVGVHPNRKIGPAMDFGCEAFPEATIFRIGRESDGTFRFFIAEGSALDKPKQFIGTSIVIQTKNPSREIVEKSIKDGFEPHFVIIKGHHAKALQTLAELFGFPVYHY